MSVRVSNIDALPEIGSRQSAVMAITNMMAAALNENENKLIFWLDAYYQLRCAYEQEHHLKALEEEAALISQEAAEEEARQIEADLKALKALFAEPPKTVLIPGDIPLAELPPEPKSPTGRLADIEDKVELKRCVLEKLQELRKAGWSGPKIQRLVDGEVGTTTVYEMLNASPVRYEKWLSMAKALDKLEMREAAYGK